MDGVNNPKVVDGCHFPVARSGAGLVPGFVRPPPTPNRDGPFPIFFLHKDEPILPSMDGRRFVERRKKPRAPDDSVPPFSPADLAVPLNVMGIGESKCRAL